MKSPRYGIAALKAFGVDNGHASQQKWDTTEVALVFNGMQGSCTYTRLGGTFRLTFEDVTIGMLTACAAQVSPPEESLRVFAFCN